jgi:hypothetical protein
MACTVRCALVTVKFSRAARITAQRQSLICIVLFLRALRFVLSSLRTDLKHLYFLVRDHSTVGIRENSVKDTAVPEPSVSPEIFYSSPNVFCTHSYIATYCWHGLNTIRITGNSDKLSKAL